MTVLIVLFWKGCRADITACMDLFRQVRWALGAVLAAVLVLLLVLWLPSSDPATELPGASADTGAASKTGNVSETPESAVQQPVRRSPGRAHVEPGGGVGPAPDVAAQLKYRPSSEKPAAPVATTPTGKDGRPLVAIVMDDMAYSSARFTAANQLPAAVSFAFLPDVEGITEMARAAQARGRDLLVHLPMEPFGPVANPGPDALMVGASPTEWEVRLQRALTSFDGYIGVNNHMGSRATSDPVMMKWLMTALKSRGLAFLDSKTTPKSVAERTARSLGVRTAARQVFLDPDGDGTVAAQQFNTALRLAKARGAVVVICHPYPKTLAFLAKHLRDDDRRYRLVPISHLLK